MEKTIRGFNFGKFVDNYGKKCSLQESSAMGGEEGSYIWLGFDNPELLQEGYDKQYPMRTRPLPDDIIEEHGIRIFGRMHLSQERVRLLIPYLQYFVDHGYLPNDNLDESLPCESNASEGTLVMITKEIPSET